MNQEFEQQIEELQAKIAFQEDTIEKLNSALSDQQKQLDSLSFKMTHVIDKLRQIQISEVASHNEETPPPHY